MTGFRLPDSLLLGSATAATQIEGGDTNNNWYAWSKAGKVGRNESSLSGVDHYRRFREDVHLLAELGHQCYRMSVEWSRIEPEPGRWSREALDHYREELTLLRDAGIEPLVTLHHFSGPQWFDDMGGWTAPEAVDRFVRFGVKVVETLGDLVAQWCTINEPNVFANDTYMDGKYPPGHHGDLRSFMVVTRHMILAHLELYERIHRTRQDMACRERTMVGFAHHLVCFETSRRGPLAWISRRLINRMFHELTFAGMVEGRLIAPLGVGQSAPRRGTRKHTATNERFCDFIGVNYYSRHIITPTPNPARLFGSIDFDPTIPEERKNDLGWEIFPHGLFSVVQHTWERYRLPIYITENGIPDAADAKRAGFLHDHLQQVQRLIDAGVDVRRYYHWSFLDNLEWNDGYGPRFGLVEVDRDTMERTVRPSARYYEKICRTHVVEEA